MDKTILISGIPEQTKLDFKAACARKGVPMREAIIEFMKLFTEETECSTYTDSPPNTPWP